MLGLQGYDKTFKQMIVVDMGFWLSVYLFLPVLPLAYRSMGLPDQSVGLAVGGYALGALAVRLPVGRLIDRFGCLPVIRFGLLLCILTVAAYPFAQTALGTTLLRFLHGVGGASYSTAAITWVTLQYGDGRLKESIALYTLCIMLGVGAATAGGSWLYQYGGFNGIVLLSLFGAAAALLGFPQQGVRPRIRRIAAPSIRSVLRQPLVWLPTLNQFVVYACYGTMTTFLPLQLATTADAVLWPFYLAYAAAVLVSRLFALRLGQLLGRYAPGTLLLLGGGTCLCPLFVKGELLLWLSGIGAGCAVGLATPILTGLVAANTESNVRGTALGLFGIAMDLGLGLGAIVMGVVATHAGYSGVFSAMTGICAIVLLINFFPIKRKETLVRSDK
ncbi:MFS transporter [Azotosporobacter soli]|uniref:MFS transporter n=1 Tax=Azotosporobacter soli TaxID=3055040 RepID=UPI0031FEAC48